MSKIMKHKLNTSYIAINTVVHPMPIAIDEIPIAV